MPQEYIYKITEEDLDKCWEFSLKYFLDETKPVFNRRVGSARGVGGILDSFFFKIIEIAVCKNLEALSVQDIEIPPDLEIRPLKKGKTEPDVYKIVDKKTKDTRDPKVYVEVKQLQSNHNWVGPTKKELDSISENEFGINDERKMYYFWCEIKDSNSDAKAKRKSSLLGSYLKHLAPNNPHLVSFHDFADMYVEIKFVHTVAEIKKGIFFPEDTVLADPEVFTQEGTSTFKKKYGQGDLSNYDKIPATGTFPEPKVYSGKKEHSLLKFFGEIKFTGDIEMYLKKDQASKKYLFVCSTPVKVTSDIGKWEFKKDEIWCYAISPSGAFPKLRNDNYLQPRRMLEQENLFQPSESVLKKIAFEI